VPTAAIPWAKSVAISPNNFLSPLLGERLAFACGGEREELLRHIHGRNGEAATSGSIGQWSVSR
jgi:hypothetical protein